MPRDSLGMRLCFRPAYYELARLIGYQGLPYEEAREKFKILEQRFGREKMVEAANDLVRVDEKEKRAVLTDEARKVCWGVLGPPPEEWDRFYRNPDGTPNPQHAQKMEQLEQLRASQEKASKPKKKRTRKKNG